VKLLLQGVDFKALTSSEEKLNFEQPLTIVHIIFLYHSVSLSLHSVDMKGWLRQEFSTKSREVRLHGFLKWLSYMFVSVGSSCGDGRSNVCLGNRNYLPGNVQSRT
jgi:hypothetical protein